VFGPGQIPTALAVSAPAMIVAGKRTAVSARLTRVDTGAPLRGEQVTFWFGDPANPGSRIGTRVVTDANGFARFTFTPPTTARKGPKIILAEYLGRAQFARPLPHAWTLLK
jgi:hypothetical protein